VALGEVAAARTGEVALGELRRVSRARARGGGEPRPACVECGNARQIGNGRNLKAVQPALSRF